jgi:hypothetical protein
VGPSWVRGWLLLTVLVGPLLACQKKAPPASEPPAAAPADPCPALCQRIRALGCKNDHGCFDNCRSMSGAAPGCGAELQAVMACFGREPLAHWECNEEGEAAIKDGYCDAEQGKFVACAGKQGVR